MSTWSVDLCQDWTRIGQLQGEAFEFHAVERFNELGEWNLQFPNAAPSWSFYTDDEGDTVQYWPRDVDTVRLVENGQVRFAGILGEATAGTGGIERRKDASGIYWSISGSDLWDLLRRRVAFPTPATATPSTWATSHDVNTGQASTVLATYLSDNLGVTAITDRKIVGFSVVDGLEGASGTWSARLQSVYELARRILSDAEMTIRWTVTADGDVTASIESPRDLSSSIVLSDDDEIVSIHTRLFPAKSTWVLVGGDGTGTGRTWRSSDSGVTGFDRRERFIDMSSLTEDDEVQAAATANRRLDAATWMATGTVADSVTERIGFGRRVFPGDKITIQAAGRRYVLPVAQVAWHVTPERQVVTPTLGEAVPDALKGLLRDVANLQARTENAIA